MEGFLEADWAALAGLMGMESQLEGNGVAHVKREARMIGAEYPQPAALWRITHVRNALCVRFISSRAL
jgi:hypothetical protein